MKLYSLKSLVEIAGVSPGFIKRLEERELIFPIEEENGVFYTERDLRKLFLAKDLKEMGINFAGIEVILDISDRMFAMKKEAYDILHRLLEYVDENIIERKY
jgi:DNA-binding transcriptional MerR regulator